MNDRWKKTGKILALAAIAALLIACAILLGRSTFAAELLANFQDPEALHAWFEHFGPYDEVVFVLLRAAQTCVKFIPAEPLEIGSGYLWGAGWGMVWCLLGNALGSCVILLLMRRFGRKVARRLLPDKTAAWLTALQQLKHLYGVLTLIYLVPGTPKDGVVYLAGLMSIDLRAFMANNTLGRIPSILTSTLCGAAAERQQYLLAGVILALTLLSALIGGFLCRKWLRRKTEE